MTKEPVRTSGAMQSSAVLLRKDSLKMDRCPQCSTAKPNLEFRAMAESRTSNVNFIWVMYQCQSCMKMVMAYAQGWDIPIESIYPKSEQVAIEIPELPRDFLKQAKETLHAPAACIMVASSSIDAMLKEKGINKHNLIDAINDAADKGIITKEMSAWAHEIRINGNDPRHVKRDSSPTTQEANDVVRLAEAFGQYLYVLPAMITRGREAVIKHEDSQNGSD